MQVSLNRRCLRSLGLAAAVSTVLAAPAAAQIPEDLSRQELACQKATFTATANYLGDVFAARHKCFDRVIRRILPSTVDCRASVDEGGTGDPDTDQSLDNALLRLSRSITAKCIGLEFDRLGFPGFCPGDLAEIYTSLAHERCLREASDDVVDVLLDFEHPPLPAIVTRADHNCQDLVARKASTMFVKEFGVRTACLQDQYDKKLAPVIECRAEEDRLEPSTGDDPTDTNVVRAHNRILRGVANGCLRADLASLGFPNRCVNPEGSDFTIAALVECMFDSHHGELIRLMDKVSPVTSICGNGELDFTEQCDDGDNSFSRGDLCRGNCTVIFNCGDTNDDGVITINDALFILRATVRLESCAIEICDIDNNGGISATDVLMLLRKVVGLDVVLRCPAPLAVTCGNSIIDRFETCDDGDTSWEFGQLCNTSCQRLLCGDPNGSGTVSALDAAYISRVIVGLETCDLAVCDVDGSGSISTADVLLVLQTATGLAAQELACPF